jgi:putative restriction endonuclease
MNAGHTLFDKIRRQGDSLNKPLLIIQALASVSRGESRLTPYAAIERVHKTALRLFSIGSKQPNPSYAFWRLQNDKLWDVESELLPTPRKSNTDPTPAELRRVGARGGFKKSIFDSLRRDPSLLESEFDRLLQAYFPNSLHDTIRTFFGLNAKTSEFAALVLEAYQNRCAISGFSAEVVSRSIGVRAASIKWLELGGPCEARNGICLASHLAEMFMLGCFTVVMQGGVFRVLLSDKVRIKIGRSAGGFLIRGGEPLSVPSGHLAPDPEFLLWHKQHVFLA